MTAARGQELRELARAQIADAIEADLKGETIMKEVWEQCDDTIEMGIVEDEMRAIISLIRARDFAP